jgi:hypothetical protein
VQQRRRRGGTATSSRLAITDPAVWDIVDGKLYLNCSQAACEMRSRDIPGHIQKGDRHLEGEVRAAVTGLRAKNLPLARVQRGASVTSKTTDQGASAPPVFRAAFRGMIRLGRTRGSPASEGSPAK